LYFVAIVQNLKGVINLTSFFMAYAVIGTDIDYVELGGGRGMIMVCISETAINLENPKIMNEAFVFNINRLSELISLEKELANQQQELKSAFIY